jgi:dUTPase
VIIEKVEPTEVVEVNELEDTLRGQGGFGSTGETSGVKTE